MKNTVSDNKKYTDSIFYETFLTGKCIKKTGEQLFSKLNFNITAEEFSALDFLYLTSGMCQRDLAQKMLVDRSAVGKILNSLEKKGLVSRRLALKGNRPVKLIKLTESGENMYIEVVAELRRLYQATLSEITEDEVKAMSFGLQKIRNVLSKVLKIDI